MYLVMWKLIFAELNDRFSCKILVLCYSCTLCYFKQEKCRYATQKLKKPNLLINVTSSSTYCVVTRPNRTAPGEIKEFKELLVLYWRRFCSQRSAICHCPRVFVIPCVRKCVRAALFRNMHTAWRWGRDYLNTQHCPLVIKTDRD